MRMLLMHNAIPEYRIPWFNYLDDNCDVDFVFTNYKLTQKLYHFDTSYDKIENLTYLIMGKNDSFISDTIRVLKSIKNYDFVEFPPTDSLKEFLVSIGVLLLCKSNNISTGYFWEKWEAPKEKQPLKRRLINIITNIIPGIIYRNVDIVFAGSTSCRDYFIQQGVSNDKICVLPDACETPVCEEENLREVYSIPNDKKIILYFGRLLVQKGLHILLQAYSEMQNRDDYYLVVAGDGENREFCQEIIKKNKLNNVVMCGWVNPDNRLTYFSQCDIFVFPGTFYEGRVDVWGLTLVEAIQNGKPVISTNAVGSAKDLIRNGVNGFIIDAMDEKKMVELLRDAIMKCDQNLSESAAEYDRNLAKIYCFDNMGKVYLDTAIDCVSKKNRR